MKKIKLTILSVFMILSASACSPIYKTDYTYSPPVTHEAGMCIEHCNGMKSLSEQTCDAKESECKYEAKQRAEDNYDRYVRERQKKGREIKMDKSDFETSSCSTSSCYTKSKENYHSCYTSCGGIITPIQKCTAFCD